jgi:site-specific DNA-methyltransferase (adenine-specific)
LSAELPDRSAVCGSYGRGRPPINRRAVSGGPGTGKKLKVESKFYPVFDDSSPPDAETFRELKRISKKLIVWGGNFFLDNLGPASCMIVWDKKRRGMDQADCEIAWSNLNGQSRIFEYRWNGMLQQNMKEKETRIHATQKPVDLYAYLYTLAKLKPGDKVLDPYLGSGSSRIAAYNAGLDFYGYEIDETYFRLQEERFEKHTSQQNLFLMGEAEP